MAAIEVTLANGSRRTFAIDGSDFIIGRGHRCQLQLPEVFISGENTAITLRMIVRDLQSSNGTWVGGERITQRELGDGEVFRVGQETGPQVRVLLSPGAKIGTERTIAPEAVDRVVELDRMIVEREREIEALRREVEAERTARTAAVDEVTSLRERVRELEQSMARATKTGRTRGGGSAKSDGEAAPQPGADPQARVAELESALASAQARIGELESSAESSPPTGTAVPLVTAAAPAAPLSAAEREDLGRLLQIFVEVGEAGVNPAVMDKIHSRAEFASDAGYVLGKLFQFSRHVEKLVTRLAQQVNRGGTPDETFIPGWEGNLTSAVNKLLLQGGDRLRGDLDRYFDKLRSWYIASLSNYRKAAQRWYEQTYQRIAPHAVERAVPSVWWKKVSGLEMYERWQYYQETFKNLTPDIVSDEIDDLAAEIAVRLAEDGGGH